MRSRERWEYEIRVVPAVKPSTAELNQLGLEGWELVSAVGVGELGAVEEIWYIFKRSLRNIPPPKD